MAIKFAAAHFTEQEALQFHSQGKPGKLEITPTKPLTTQRDLSLAYSPGVAVPVLAISRDPSLAYDYTNKANLVAVVSNGTAILGLGNLGAQAAKPVMEGKGALFKRFADIDAIDVLVDTPDVDAVINCVRYLGPSFGGINLEDIKAPDCFIIEEKLKELLNIPVFHDDQHGTAIIAAAGLINALDLTDRDIGNFKLVVNGAGAAGIACLDLLVAMGMPRKNVIFCDTKGVIYQGRKEGMNQWKSGYAAKTKARSLADALEGADAFFGLSAAGAVTKAMVKSMAPKPIIFAMANPDPEITPEEVAEVRPDAITATGRSDYPNQINNVLGFPFIFRGALDVQASTINEAMKIAAARALADLAREDVPDLVAAAFMGRQVKYGPDYIIPAPVRSSPHHARAARRRQGGHGDGRGAPADRRHGGLRRAPVGAARSGRGLAAQHLRPGAQFAQAHRLCRGRAAAGRARRQRLPQRRSRSAHPDRPRRADPRGLRLGRHRAHRRDRDARHQPRRAAPGVQRVPVLAPAAQGLPAARLPAPRQQRPQRVRRLHGGHGPRRRHGHGRHPRLVHGLRGRAQSPRCARRPARDRLCRSP